MHPRHAHTLVRVVLLLLGGGVFGFSVALAWAASSNPLELEAREGSVWIHVLASRAGVDIYDPLQVAFVNMNHGPLDPVLKTWISRCIPSLPGHFITRAFVLAAPFFFLGSALAILRKRPAVALLAAGALHLFLTHVSLLTLVGRSDATALCGLGIAGVLTHRLLEESRWGWFQRGYVLRQLGLGAASSAVFLISSRYLPAVLAFQFVVIAARLGNQLPIHVMSGASARWRRGLTFGLEQVTMAMFFYLVGFALVWVPTFLIELHGSWDSYYKHFFGFFSSESGWGTFAGPTFEVFPRLLLLGRLPTLAAWCGLLTLAGFQLRKRRAELVAWLLMLVTLWMALSYGYYKNEAGGGLHYFFEFFVVAWVFVLHALSKRQRRPALAGLAIFGAILVSLPWPALFSQYEIAVQQRARSHEFLEAVRERTGGEQIFGEGTHLYKTSYQGEVVDTGDAAYAMATSHYFGSAFTYTYNTYTNSLVTSPPRFVMAAVLIEHPFRGIMTPTLQELLQSRYRQVLIARGSAFALGGSQALYELIPRPHKARQRR